MSADVIKDNGQLILVLRESVTSYTAASFIPDEKSTSLRNGLIAVTTHMRSPRSPVSTVRTDPASGFRSLVNDAALKALSLQVELGEAKNPNKNPVAEKAIEELRFEIVRLQPSGGKISPTILARAVSNLNSRIRHNKLSAFEMFTQRDMSSGTKLEVNDEKLIDSKIQQRNRGHEASSKYKARGKTSEVVPIVNVGDIVYLYVDRLKSQSRNKYLVVEIEPEHVQVQKLVNNQLRARKYRIRNSGIITVPSAIPTEDSKGYDEEPCIPSDVPPPVSKPLKTVPPSYPIPDSDSSSDEESSLSTVLNRHSAISRQEPPVEDDIDELSADSPDETENEDEAVAVLSDAQEKQATDDAAEVVHSDPLEEQETVEDAAVVMQSDPQETHVRPRRRRKEPTRLQDFIRGSITPLPDSDDSDTVPEPKDTSYKPPSGTIKRKMKKKK